MKTSEENGGWSIVKKVPFAAMCLAMSLCVVLPSLAAAAPSHMSTPAPKKMVISAPATVRAGEEFTVKVARRDDGSPVDGASVYLASRYEPLARGSGEDGKTSTGTPRLLGVTGAEGELKVTLPASGSFFLTAEKAGFAQGFSAIAVGKLVGEVSFTASKKVFGRGEPVTFTLKNGHESAVTLSNGAPWEISRPNGDDVFSPNATMAIVEVGAGEEKTWTWDQKDSEGVQVKPGVYACVLQTSAGPIAAQFCIGGLRTEKGQENPDPEMPEVRPFKDVTGGQPWGDPHILRLYQRNIIRGKSADSFDPEGSLTRAEFVAMLLRACGVEPRPEEGGDAFADVTPSHWAYACVFRAREMGILKPDEYPEGFGPDVPITRMEICVMAARALGLEGEAGQNAGETLGFEDGEEVALAYRGYVMSAVDWGVLKGYPDNTFRQGKNATRREAAVIIYRLMQAD